MDHGGPRPSTVASEDELGAHAAAGWPQLMEVSTWVIFCCTSLLSVEG